MGSSSNKELILGKQHRKRNRNWKQEQEQQLLRGVRFYVRIRRSQSPTASLSFLNSMAQARPTVYILNRGYFCLSSLRSWDSRNPAHQDARVSGVRQ